MLISDSYCFIGVDPGSVNLGYSLLNNAGAIIDYGTINPLITGTTNTVRRISSLVIPHTTPILVVERYVAYKGVMNSASEDILMLLGALVYEFESKDETVLQFRAIDWKPQLCKHLYKERGFKNPSTKFDKKFSLAAAREIEIPELGEDIKNDHEGDAICLGYMGYLYVQEKRQKEKNQESRTGIERHESRTIL